MVGGLGKRGYVSGMQNVKAPVGERNGLAQQAPLGRFPQELRQG